MTDGLSIHEYLSYRFEQAIRLATVLEFINAITGHQIGTPDNVTFGFCFTLDALAFQIINKRLQ